jgi:putative NADH-flavin reductase
MRIAVVGANGRAGLEVVKQGLKRGYEVNAIARWPAAVGLKQENLTIHAADVLDPVALEPSLVGVDAVVSALGIGTSRAATVVYSGGIKNIVSVMGRGGPKVLVVISATPVGPREEHPFIDRRMAMPILESVLHATYEDMRRMEAVLQESDVNWISVRPPRLVKRAATGVYRLSTQPLPRGRKITYSDLATALLDAIDREDLYRKVAFVAN